MELLIITVLVFLVLLISITIVIYNIFEDEYRKRKCIERLELLDQRLQILSRNRDLFEQQLNLLLRNRTLANQNHK